MKLLTHNMLMSPGTRNGYPLAIEVEKMEEVEAEFNAEFMARMVDKIDYGALLKTVSSVLLCLPSTGKTCSFLPHALLTLFTCTVFHSSQLQVDSSLPAAVPDKYAEDEPFLTALHHVLMEIEIIEGQLVCPET